VACFSISQIHQENLLFYYKDLWHAFPFPGFIKSTYFSIIKLCGMLFHFPAEKVYAVKPLLIVAKGTAGEKKCHSGEKLQLQDGITSVTNTSKQQNENYKSSTLQYPHQILHMSGTTGYKRQNVYTLHTCGGTQYP
jgi:hypothetical protein